MGRLHEPGEDGAVDMVAQRPSVLVGRIQHGPRETGIGDGVESAEVQALVGEEDGDEGDAVGRQASQRHDGGKRAGGGREAHLHEVDARRGDHACADAQDIGRNRRIADRRAHRAPSRHMADRAPDFRDGEGAERARGRVLQVDEVRPAGEGRFDLAERGHACQKPGHEPAAELSPALYSATRSISQSQASLSRGPAVLSMAICR